MENGNYHNGFDALTKAIGRPLSRSDLLRLMAGAISAAAVSGVWPGQSRADVFLHNRYPSNPPAQCDKSSKEIHLFDFLSSAQKRAARRGLIPDITAQLILLRQ
jgi:hypothetical protein